MSETVLELTVERPAIGGAMIARHDGCVVLVTGAIPGERVRAIVERTRRDVIFARVCDVIEPHADRRTPSGDPGCGGHAYAHIAYERQRALKSEIVADGLRRLARLTWTAPIHVAPSPSRGYRMRSRLHAQRGRLGFLREGSHSLCDAAGTGQLREESVEALRGIEACLTGIDGGGVTEVELTENLAGDERALHVWMDATANPRRLAALAACTGLQGVTAGTPHGGVGQTLGGDPTVADRLPAICQTVLDVPLRRHAASFFQANRFLLGPLVTRVTALADSARVLDLYAGVGLFSLALAGAGVERVVAVERDAASTEDLKTNVLQTDVGGRITPVCRSVEAFVAGAEGRDAGAIIVDPPRTGLSRAVATALPRLGAPRIVYVSCDVATCARDVGRLMSAGYRVSHLEAFDFFPQTAHVELVAALDRDP
jgi:tRNA/tmRNA/rRNA uracil-C5-methylase (TrmA/RlmC/RlmD family)